jgi:hypothetical protein
MHFRYAKMHSLMNPVTETPSNLMGPFVESGWPNMILTAGVRFSGRENLVHHSHLPASSPVAALLPTATAALAADLFNRADRPQFDVRPQFYAAWPSADHGPVCLLCLRSGRERLDQTNRCMFLAGSSRAPEHFYEHVALREIVSRERLGSACIIRSRKKYRSTLRTVARFCTPPSGTVNASYTAADDARSSTLRNWRCEPSSVRAMGHLYDCGAARFRRGAIEPCSYRR